MTLLFSAQPNRPRTHHLTRWAAGIGLASLTVLTAACGASTTSAASHPAKKAAKAPTAVRQKGTNALIEGATPYAGTTNLDHYLSLAKSHPAEVNAVYHAAVAEFVNGNFPQSLSFYQKAIKLSPTDGTLWNNMANIYNYTLKKPQAALPDYQKAIQYDPKNPINWSNLINCEVSLKNTAAAKQDAEKALQVLPKEPTNAFYKAIEGDLQAFNHPASAASPTTKASS